MDYKSPFETEQVSQFDSFELQVNAQSQDFLRETAKWATFLSIMAFIFIGLMLLISIVLIAFDEDITMAARRQGAESPSGIFMGVTYIVLSVLAFIPALYLSKFAGKMKSALESNRTDKLTEAFETLKSHYKTAGIITIVFVSLFILSIIFNIIAEIGKAAGAY